MRLPRHECELTITHNTHKNEYISVEQWIKDNEKHGFSDWVSNFEKQSAIEKDEIWELHWYADTPDVFRCVVGSTLGAVLRYAIQIQEEEDEDKTTIQT